MVKRESVCVFLEEAGEPQGEDLEGGCNMLRNFIYLLKCSHDKSYGNRN